MTNPAPLHRLDNTNSILVRRIFGRPKRPASASAAPRSDVSELQLLSAAACVCVFWFLGQFTNDASLNATDVTARSPVAAANRQTTHPLSYVCLPCRRCSLHIPAHQLAETNPRFAPTQTPCRSKNSTVEHDLVLHLHDLDIHSVRRARSGQLFAHEAAVRPRHLWRGFARHAGWKGAPGGSAADKLPVFLLRQRSLRACSAAFSFQAATSPR